MLHKLCNKKLKYPKVCIASCDSNDKNRPEDD